MRSRGAFRLTFGLATMALAGLAAPDPAVAQADDDYAATAGLTAVVNDPTLGRLLTAALDANPDLRAADARVRAARAERLEAGLDLAPVVTASGGYTRQKMAGATFPGATGSLPEQDLWEAGVQMSWDVDVFGRGRRSYQGRGAMLSAAEEDVDDARVLLAADVATAYFRLRGEEDRLAVARRNAENQRRTLAVTRERLEAGRGTALDTERAAAQLSSTLAIIAALEASTTAAENRISALVGEDAGAILDARDHAATPLALPAALPDELPAPDELVRDRADLRAAERRVAASHAFAGAARSDYLPRISVQAAAGYTASAFDAFGNDGTPRYVIGPVVSWPLLDLGRVKARADGARAREVEAEAQYRGALLRAVEEVGTSRVAYERALERLGHLEEAAAASERATDLARLRFEEGATDFLEVLDAERRQLEAQDRLAAGRTEAALALVSHYRALGGRWPGT